MLATKNDLPEETRKRDADAADRFTEKSRGADKHAGLAARIAKKSGATVVSASMRDFDCPSYDGDLEKAQGVPTGAQKLKRRIDEADAFIVSSPEYNGSMPGMLKNAIDWASRFRPQPFDGKHGLLLSASPSMAGRNRGRWTLRVPLEHLGARIYPEMGADRVDPVPA